MSAVPVAACGENACMSTIPVTACSTNAIICAVPVAACSKNALICTLPIRPTRTNIFYICINTIPFTAGCEHTIMSAFEILYILVSKRLFSNNNTLGCCYTLHIQITVYNVVTAKLSYFDVNNINITTQRCNAREYSIRTTQCTYNIKITRDCVTTNIDKCVSVVVCIICSTITINKTVYTIPFSTCC